MHIIPTIECGVESPETQGRRSGHRPRSHVLSYQPSSSSEHPAEVGAACRARGRSIEGRFPAAPRHLDAGTEALPYITPGQLVALVGPSGAGKNARAAEATVPCQNWSHTA